MPRKPTVANKRLANKIIWALEDIQAICLDLRDVWRYCVDRATENQDPVMLAYLARFRDRLADIEATAHAARHGEYRDKGTSGTSGE